MNHSEILDKVIDIVARDLRLPKEEVLLDSDIIYDLGAESIHCVEIPMEIEEEFEIPEITMEEFDANRTPEALVALIERKLAEKEVSAAQQ